FVPIFTELEEHGRKREAARLAATLLLIILFALTALTLLFIAAAGVLLPLVTPTELKPVEGLVVGFSRVLFPIVVILAINGLVVGILQAYDHFTIPALAPLVWNLVI